MQMLKKPTVTETISLNRLHWFGHVQRMEENRIPKRVLYMNLGTTRLRGRPRNRWQDEVREDVRIVGGEGWQEKVHNREEWKKLLRKARNHRILHMPMEWMNENIMILIHTVVAKILMFYTWTKSKENQFKSKFQIFNKNSMQYSIYIRASEAVTTAFKCPVPLIWCFFDRAS